jgi:hypothetical protein
MWICGHSLLIENPEKLANYLLEMLPLDNFDIICGVPTQRFNGDSNVAGKLSPINY